MEELEWSALWKAMKETRGEWIPTTKEMYWECLEVIPPAAMAQKGFLMGEASFHEDGKAYYAAFVVQDGKYSARYLTVAEFRQLA